MSENIDKALDVVISDIDRLIESLGQLRDDLIEVSRLEQSSIKRSAYIDPQELRTIRELKESKEIPARVANSLLRAGVVVLSDLRFVCFKDLLNLPNLGPKNIKILQSYLSNCGIELEDTEPEFTVLPLLSNTCKLLIDEERAVSTNTIPLLHKGDKVTIQDVHINTNQYLFSMPYYKCTCNGEEYYLTPGTVEFTDE